MNRDPDERARARRAGGADEFDAIVAGLAARRAGPGVAAATTTAVRRPRPSMPPRGRRRRGPREPEPTTSTSSHRSRRRCPGSARPRSSGWPCSGSGLVLVIAPGWLGISDAYGAPARPARPRRRARLAGAAALAGRRPRPGTATATTTARCSERVVLVVTPHAPQDDLPGQLAPRRRPRRPRRAGRCGSGPAGGGRRRSPCAA